MKNMLFIRKMIAALMAVILLAWAFPKNDFFGKIIISPFFICAAAYFGENLFLLLGKERISNLFARVFHLSFFAYVLGFLLFALYYSLVHQEYTLLPVIVLFVVILYAFLR